MSRFRNWTILAALIMVVSVILSACSPAATPTPMVVEKEQTKIVEQTKIIEKLVTPTPAPITRTGAWLDTVIVVEEPSTDAAISRLETGDVDGFWYSVSSSMITRYWLFGAKIVDTWRVP